MKYKTILYKTDDRVARIILNRPEKMNAMSREMCDEVEDAVHVADRDREVRVVLLSGAGGRAFSAEYDLGDESTQGRETIEDYSVRLHRALQFT